MVGSFFKLLGTASYEFRFIVLLDDSFEFIFEMQSLFDKAVRW